jgi:hypothetical protein
MRHLGLLFACILTLPAQEVFPSTSKEAATLAPFFADPLPKDDVKIRCRLYAFTPRLSFGFQYWSGFDVSVAARELVATPKDKPLTIAAEITNQSGVKYYVFNRSMLPQNIPDEFWERKNVELNLGGGFVVGEGKYKARLLVVDASGRACRDDWKFEAKSTNAPTPVPPGEVRTNDFRWNGIPSKPTSDRVTIFLHAAPFYARRNITRLRPWDQSVLLGSLTSFLSNSRFAKARVVVFNLDARRILFTTEDFSRRDFFRLARALESFNMGTVSIETLTGRGEAQFLEDVVRDEAARTADRSSATVFLGPSWRWGQKLTPVLKELGAQLPDPTYLSIASAFYNTEDILHAFVKSNRGRVIDVYNPLDLAKAIRKIDNQ